jgi:putative endonuclease
MGTAQLRGRHAEAFAAQYLELIGYRVLDRNRRLAGVEVDLVAADGPTQVVVEVKCRGRDDFGGAAGAIHYAKRARLRHAALALQPEARGHVRVDVIALELSAEGLVLRHFRNAVTDG